MKNKGAYRQRKRARLFEEQNGRCYYCGSAMSPGPFARGKKVSLDGATFEHLHSRMSPARLSPHDGVERRIVLACRRCNEARGAAEFLGARRRCAGTRASSRAAE